MEHEIAAVHHINLDTQEKAVKQFFLSLPVDPQGSLVEVNGSAVGRLVRLPVEDDSMLADTHTPEELELLDWNTYFDLLRSGELNEYRGKFIVVFRGKVVAAGDDPRVLRRQISEKERVPPELLVIPFVDDKECLVAE